MKSLRFALTTGAILTTGHISRSWNNNWDYMHNSGNEKKTKHHIILVRHGQYVSDHKDLKRLSGEEDYLHNDPLRALTKLGREQAEHAGECISKILNHEGLLEGDGSAVRVFCSDMARAHETATIIYDKLQKSRAASNISAPLLLQKDSILREGAPCKPEGYDWNPADSIFFQEGCRIEAAFRKFFHRQAEDRPGIEKEKVKQSVDVVVAHGNLIRYCFFRALQLDPGAWLHLGLYNASITRIAISDGGRVSVRGLGETGHIPLHKQTYN
ncbi:hypothetical protein HDV01_001144 [Terramyces sp. JEL0728]|nr:hypothetical protein HDV01_001144 [Terramyces sp. JEL0728]